MSLPTERELAELTEATTAIRDACARSLLGKEDVISLAVEVMLASGHLLLEDVPGVGKTTLAKALAHAIGGSVGRLQFTPDLLPSDVTGISVFRADSGVFEFRPGPVFANVVIGDEINRTSPKTQSALLEAMQEATVTVDGTTYQLPAPFMVIATQNPIEMAGTYPLPEAQRDRFMAQTTIGYPDAAAQSAMLDPEIGGGVGGSAEEAVQAVSPHEVLRAAEVVRRIHVSPALRAYVVALVDQTRNDSALRLGASPRAAVHLVRMAQARAAMAGRDHVLPDDVQGLVVPVLAHRLLPRANSTASLDEVSAILHQIMHRTALPTGDVAPSSVAVGAVRERAWPPAGVRG